MCDFPNPLSNFSWRNFVAREREGWQQSQISTLLGIRKQLYWCYGWQPHFVLVPLSSSFVICGYSRGRSFLPYLYSMWCPKPHGTLTDAFSFGLWAHWQVLFSVHTLFTFRYLFIFGVQLVFYSRLLLLERSLIHTRWKCLGTTGKRRSCYFGHSR